MKRAGLMVAGFFASLMVAGAFEIPRGTHEIDELQNAQAEAADRKKPLVFLYSKTALKPT